MKKFILIALSLFSLSSFAQTVLWPEGLPFVRVGGLSMDGKYEEGISAYALFGRAFSEIEDYVSVLQGKPRDQVKLSFNYVQYRQGYHVMSMAEYVAKPQDFAADDEELAEIRKKGERGELTRADFKGSRWLHVVQALDKDEVNCLAISKVNGKLGGCNDIWQDGLQEDELECFKGRTYPKCHLDCIRKI
jgi:hypothetical protein